MQTVQPVVVRLPLRKWEATFRTVQECRNVVGVPCEDHVHRSGERQRRESGHEGGVPSLSLTNLQAVVVGNPRTR